MTLSTVLAGMLPPLNTAMDWLSGFNWQPIPIFSEPLNQDSVCAELYKLIHSFSLERLFQTKKKK